MAYIDGFVIPVRTADKAAFVDHAERIDKFFLDHGALRVVENWADDLPETKVTGFDKAVQATNEETVVFSWIEWPDKTTRDAAVTAMESNAEMMAGPMPFDGKRMIFGGFAPFVDERRDGQPGYVDGFVLPTTPANRDAYVKLADEAAAKFIGYGALRSCESWGDDVSEGKVTDFYKAVAREGDEAIVFSFVEWPDKAARDAGWEKVMADPSMVPETTPFDMKRMFWGGFVPVYDVSKG